MRPGKLFHTSDPNERSVDDKESGGEPEPKVNIIIDLKLITTVVFVVIKIGIRAVFVAVDD